MHQLLDDSVVNKFVYDNTYYYKMQYDQNQKMESYQKKIHNIMLRQ